MFRFISIVLFSGLLFSEEYSIISDSASRSFSAYFPDDTTVSAPMVIIMHGLGGTNTDMEFLKDYFIDLGVVPVFPQGYFYENINYDITAEIYGSTTIWNIANFPEYHDDVLFINDLIDYMIEQYSFINTNRIYATGMSMGGYMSYRLACDLSDKITAVASVTGNFYLIDDGTDCTDQNREVPIMHIHGTYDNVVAYDIGAYTVFGDDVYGDENLTILESIDFWTDYNNLTVETIDTLMADGGYWWYGQWIATNSIKFSYSSESSNTQFIHIKAEGGAHIWFIDDWGWGFDAHEEAYNFFMQYQLSDFFNPHALQNFTLNALENYVSLTWDVIENSDLNYYVLEKSTDNTFLDNVETFYLSSNGYNDHDIESDIEYFYRVYYSLDNQFSNFSDTLSITLEFINIENNTLMPSSPILYQNYPNPFNPTTSIKYNLSKKTNVNIKIFNLNGRIMMDYIKANQPLGSYSTKWNGTNMNGQLVPAGMYFYSLQTKNYKQTRKMILIK